MSTNIYCCYHDPQLLLDYGVKEQYDINFNLITLYTKEQYIDKKSINTVQNYFGEFSNQYYIWANNIYSDKVGFCQYSKMFNKTFLYNYTYFYDKYSNILNECIDKINDNIVVGITSNYIEFNNEKFLFYLSDINKHFDILFDLFKNFIKDKYNNLYSNFENLLKEEDMNKLIRFNCYLCNWKTFNEYMKFVYYFFDYIGLNLDLINADKIEKWYIHNNLTFPNKDWWFDRDRYFAYYIEYILAIYMYISNKQIIYTHKIIY